MKLVRLVWCSFVLGAAVAVAQEPSTSDLTDLPLEDLMNIEVTSVSRSPEPISKAAAAVTVITEEDIRRSGATTLPEALRLSPGLEVARVDAHTWAVSSRGFNDVFANKLLVMIDGRTVYTPLFSGVFWDAQDTLLEDIDRIEVVRGPGATLWGANAVNGVINIITKSAKDTQGLLISGGGGTELLGFGNIRYGAKVNDELYARVYAKYANHDDSKLPSGADANDRWDMWRGGFRLDWQPSDPNLLTFQGDVYFGTLSQTYGIPTTTPPFVRLSAGDFELHGGNLLGRWSHTFSEESDLTLQAYVDHTTRNADIFREERDTEDVDFQHQFALGERQRVIWGGGFRRTDDEADNTVNVSLTPESRGLDLFSGFLQDEITIVPDRFSLTLGSKFEHNDFTGFEVQPSARVLWTPVERHAVWASVSRAVRTPSRAEDDVRINPPVPGVPLGSEFFPTLTGNRNFESEELIAYEIGYRLQPVERLSVDLAVFYNDYDDLRSLEPVFPAAPLSPTVAANGLKGETYGFEIANTIDLANNWRITGGYTYLQMQMHRKAGSFDLMSERALEGADPHHQFFIRSAVDFGERHDWGHEFQFDSVFRYVETIIVSGSQVPSYFTLDLRLAWRPTANLEIAIVGQNLLDDRHPEFNPTTIPTQRTEVERSAYAKLTLRF